MAIVVEDFFGRARREAGAYREYAADEQRRLGEKRPTGMVMNDATDPLANARLAKLRKESTVPSGRQRHHPKIFQLKLHINGHLSPDDQSSELAE